MNSYILNRHGHYYFRIRIPSDLSNVLLSTELVKSLKTKDHREAQLAVLPYQQGIIKTFSLLRSAFISVEQAKENIDSLLKRKQKSTLLAPVLSHSQSPHYHSPKIGKIILLSEVIKQFIEDHKHGWRPKSKLEYESSYHLSLDLVGDIEVKNIDRVVVRSLRDDLMKLPANVYKIFPKKTAVKVLEIIKDIPTDLTLSILTVNKFVMS